MFVNNLLHPQSGGTLIPLVFLENASHWLEAFNQLINIYSNALNVLKEGNEWLCITSYWYYKQRSADIKIKIKILKPILSARRNLRPGLTNQIFFHGISVDFSVWLRTVSNPAYIIDFEAVKQKTYVQTDCHTDTKRNLVWRKASWWSFKILEFFKVKVQNEDSFLFLDWFY